MVDVKQAEQTLRKIMQRHCHNLTLEVTPAGGTDKTQVVAQYRLPMRKITPGNAPDTQLNMAERLASRYVPKGDVMAEAVKHAIPEGSFSITHPDPYGETRNVISTPTQTRIEFLADATQLDQLCTALILKGLEEPQETRSR